MRKSIGGWIWIRTAATSLAFALFPVQPAIAEQPALEGLRHHIEQRHRKFQEWDEFIQSLADRLELMERGWTSSSALADTPPDKPLAGDAKLQLAAAPAPSGEAKGTEIKVDDEAAERALERSLVVQGALLLRFGKAEIQPSFNYARSEFNVPFQASVNGFPILANERVRRNRYTPSLGLRAGLPWESQLELATYYEAVDEDRTVNLGGGLRNTSDESGSSYGNLTVGLAKTLLREKSWWPDVIGRATYNIGTGQKSDNNVALSGGFDSIRGALVALKRQDPLAFSLNLSYLHRFSDEGFQPGSILGVSLGVNLAASPETSLYFSLDQSFVDEAESGGQAIENSDQVQSSLVVGTSSILGRNVLLNVSVGVGLTDDVPDYSVNVSLPIRFDVPLPSFD